MGKIMIWCTGLALVGAVAGCGQPTAVRTAGSRGAVTGSRGAVIGSWGKAIEVPGLAALNKGGDASVTSVSCASPGNCAAAGDYADHHGVERDQGFVADERNGRWGAAIPVPGLATLNTGGYAEVNAVSCASAGNCAAGGDYSFDQGFVASERHGRWGTAIEVPGLGALNTGRDAEVDSVSCASAGNCVAAGYYSHGQIGRRGFVASEQNGRWGTAIEVPGLAALDKDGYSDVTSVSCASAGNCAAGGYYTFHGGDQGSFVASERNGRWATAIKVPGPGALSTGQDGGVSSVSCASAGNCAAGGGGNELASVTNERSGHWGRAIAVPGLRALDKDGHAGVFSVSCGSAGDCAAGGFYARPSTPRHEHGFVVVERNGHWGTAIPVPGLAALNTGRDAEVLTMSCASAGNCAAGGFYFDRPHHYQWFVAVERNGRWGTAIAVPGFSDLNKRTDGVDFSYYFSVSCAPAGTCAAGGYYFDASGHDQGFVTQAG
jgi:hypothetical protein